ncbi:MAG: hypothetical protein FWF66_01345 [Candidatus Bathyarchaeota archaeon]|nr:hypothetical protein [Candidatus Termiticorpusculum sp.]MCL1970098.1 hypothetical protein [Candidatus Termiticorpusculum sp.]
MIRNKLHLTYTTTGCRSINDFPVLTFKIGTGQTKNDRVWLTKKKDYYEKTWKKSGQKILQKIEDTCGDTFTDPSKEKGIQIILYKKTAQTRYGNLKENNPLEISLYLSKTDNTNTAKELLIRMLVHSFIWQQYEYRFRNREQTLFEDILADEYIAAIATFTVLGRKLGRANCAKALEQAVEGTVYRLSQKQTQNKLVDLLYNFFQEEKTKTKKSQNLLEKREELIQKLLTFLPKTIETDF